MNVVVKWELLGRILLQNKFDSHVILIVSQKYIISRTELNELKTWLSSAIRQMAWAQANNHDKIMGEQVRRDAEMRRPKLKELNAIAASLKSHSALVGQEVGALNSDWEDMERKIGIVDAVAKNNGALQATSNANKVSLSATKSPASQISARIEKMLEVLSTIDRQLTSTVLAGKHFENLESQSEALDTIQHVRLFTST